MSELHRSHYIDLLQIALELNLALQNASSDCPNIELIKELKSLNKLVQCKLRELPYIDDERALG